MNCPFCSLPGSCIVLDDAVAVLDLARAAGLAENRIVYGPHLLGRYRRFFDAVCAPGDHANALPTSLSYPLRQRRHRRRPLRLQ